MSLSRMTCSLPRALQGLAVVVAAWLLTTNPAAAQQPGSGPQIPIGARAYQASVIRRDYYLQHPYPQTPPQATYQPRPAQTASATRPAPYSVTVAVGPTRREPTPVYVNLQGPNSEEVRKFRLEGGRDAIQARPITVRAGETVTLRFLASAPAPSAQAKR